MLGWDVRRGDLWRCGFESRPHPLGLGSKVYQREGWQLHSRGMTWRGITYHRDRGCFLRSWELPPEAQGPRLSIREGWEHFRPLLRQHEQQLVQRWGVDFRQQMLRSLPPRLKPLRRHFLEAYAELASWEENRVKNSRHGAHRLPRLGQNHPAQLHSQRSARSAHRGY